MKLTRWLVGFLFVFLVFVVGFASQIPASFVLQKFNHHLPADWHISQPKGTLWQGQVSVSYKGVGFNQLSWQLKSSDVLLVWLKKSLPISLQLRHNQDQLDLDLVVAADQMKLFIAQGQLDMARFAAPFAQQHFVLNGLKGQLHLRDLFVIIEFNPEFMPDTPWIKDVAGRVAITDLSVMGAEVEQLIIEAMMQQQTVLLELKAEEESWQLSGSSRLSPPNQFENQFELNTEQPNQFPDWALMTMHQVSPTQARAQITGRW
ncbi:type II secretion system protein N [Thiomicrospira sp. R3]|uniref:type II secretion system protein N n=1 Tax=Thiomicrospira sp. R3 TaxID=3035472 RepID=UPI00259B4398|nr:type II secretion system protein N [Thiomicrospira sp. R3]WFE69023.1 type II secretion system protein N [Thiomicrospira sp. R3]